MTITITPPTGVLTIYTHRTIPAYVDYTVKLISKYSHKDILADATVVYSSHTDYEDWAKITFAYTGLTQNSNYTDYSGYYDCQVIGITGVPAEIIIEQNLCKVETPILADTVFTSDNENNEQIIFYR